MLFTGPAASENGNPSYYQNFSNPAITPEPIRGPNGANIVGGQTDVQIDRQNPDLLARPSTDSGSTGNLKWPLSLSSNRLEDGGWARQGISLPCIPFQPRMLMRDVLIENVKSLPLATQMAGVQFRLLPGAYR